MWALDSALHLLGELLSGCAGFAETGGLQDFRQTLQFARRELGCLDALPLPLMAIPEKKAAGMAVVGVVVGSRAVMAHSWSVPTDAATEPPGVCAPGKNVPVLHTTPLRSAIHLEQGTGAIRAVALLRVFGAPELRHPTQRPDQRCLKRLSATGVADRLALTRGAVAAFVPAAPFDVLVANLAPRKMKFGVSEGMVLAASHVDQSAHPGVYVLEPWPGAVPGLRVR